MRKLLLFSSIFIHMLKFLKMSLRSTTLFYSYTQAYNDNVSAVVNTSIHDVRSHESNTTQMEYQCNSLYCSISISATECYIFISKELTDKFILYSQMCIRKCNITAIFLSAPNVGTGLSLNGNSI